MARLGKQQRRHVIDTLADLRGAARQLAIDHLLAEFAAAGLTVSRRTIERIAPAGTRKRRADAGDARIELDEDALLKMFRLTVDMDFTAEQVIASAERAGWIEPGAVSAGTYNRWLQDRRISRRENARDNTPRRRMEAPFSNHTHQLDFTRAEQYYIAHAGNIEYLRDWELNKNKVGPSKKGHALWIYAIVDDFSRVLYARAYPALNTHFALDFLRQAWSQKPGCPMYGMPKTLFSDNDAIFGRKPDHKFRRALDALGVEFVQHQPTHAWAKGKIESKFRWLNQQQAVTRIERFQSIDEFNVFLADCCARYNTRVHRETHARPNDRWQLGMRGQVLRELPEKLVYEVLLYDSFDVRVRNDMVVRVPNRGPVQLPMQEPYINWVNRTVQVSVSPARPDVLEIDVDGETYLVDGADPKRHEVGEYRAAPMTQADRLRAEVKQADVSEARQYGDAAKRQEGIAHLPHRLVEKFDVTKLDKRLQPVVLDRVEAKLRIIDALGAKPTPEQNAWLDDQLRYGIAEDVLPRILARLQDWTPPEAEEAAG